MQESQIQVCGTETTGTTIAFRWESLAESLTQTIQTSDAGLKPHWHLKEVEEPATIGAEGSRSEVGFVAVAKVGCTGYRTQANGACTIV